MDRNAVGGARAPSASALLVVDIAGLSAAVAVEDVIETMRLLPFTPVADAPAWVLGVALIRGVPTPLVDLAALLGGEPGRGDRLVSLRGGEGRAVAVRVDGVRGVYPASSLRARGLPPLLQEARPEVVGALARLDHGLLTVLRAGHLVPDAVWASLSGPGTS